MRPRAARRAAAQLQSLFDSSLTYSSSKMVTIGNTGIGNAMITPTIQVITYFLTIRLVLNIGSMTDKDLLENNIITN